MVRKCGLSPLRRIEAECTTVNVSCLLCSHIANLSAEALTDPGSMDPDQSAGFAISRARTSCWGNTLSFPINHGEAKYRHLPSDVELDQPRPRTRVSWSIPQVI